MILRILFWLAIIIAAVFLSMFAMTMLIFRRMFWEDEE